MTHLLLSLHAALLAPQVHVADFTRSDTPNGLSRRGYTDSDEFGPYEHPVSDWFQLFWGGRYRLVNMLANQPGGTNGWVCMDLGTGAGDAELPGPLVYGGAFTGRDFGPYAVPFVFEARFEQFSQFAGAQISVDDPPPGAAALAGKKALGVVFSFENQGSATIHQLTAGLWAAAQDIFLDVHDPSFGSVVPARVQVNGLLPTDAWTLRVEISRSSVVAAIVRDGATMHQVVATKAGNGNPALFLDIRHVKAAALRASGYVTLDPAQPIGVERIEIGSPGLPAFAGPRTGSLGPDRSTRPFVRRLANALVSDDTVAGNAASGGLFQGAGTNRVDLLNYFAGFDATPEYGRHVLQELAARTDQRIVRFSCGDEYGKYVNPVVTGAPATRHPLLALYESNRDAYFTAFDELVDTATELGIRLVPVLVWSPGSVFAHLNGLTGVELRDPSALASVLSVYGISANPPAGSPEYVARQFTRDFVTAIVARYKDHPTILAWEIGNEWDNYINQSLWTEPLPPELYPYELWSRPEDCRHAEETIARWILDASRPVLSGRRHPISSGYANSGIRHDDPALVGAQQSTSNYILTLQRYNSPLFDILSFHFYPFTLVGCPPGGSGCISATPCSAFPPAPFESWDCLMKTIAAEASVIYGDGRVVVIGETNLNERITYDANMWQSVLESFTGASTPGAAPRVAYCLSWGWMNVPHMAYDDRFDMRPADVLELDTRLVANRANRFERVVAEPFAAPRILTSGWGTTFAYSDSPVSARVRVRVADPQDDVESVQVLDAAGTTVLLELTEAGGGSWIGTLPYAPSPPGKYFRQIRARDAKGHVSLYAPRLAFGPPVDSPGPIPTGSDPTGQDPGAIPFVRSAGTWGFDPLSSEGHHLRFIAEISDRYGVPLTGAVTPEVTVQGRLDLDGALTAGAGWTTGLFEFFDDGLQGGDLVANDGIWTSDLFSSEDSLTGISSRELLVEVRAHRMVGGVRRFSDIWPRFVVH